MRPAQAHDRTIAAAAVTAAFFDDPVTAWIVPERAHRPAILPTAFQIYVDAFLPHGETYLTDDGAGAALWLQPGRALLEDHQLEEFGRRLEDAAGHYAGRLFQLGEIFDAHAPIEPHWHLQFLATLPERQGQGIGSALLVDQLRRLDGAGESAYLEATTLRNRALYERHGFESIGTIVLPDGPTLTRMWRSPR